MWYYDRVDRAECWVVGYYEGDKIWLTVHKVYTLPEAKDLVHKLNGGCNDGLLAIAQAIQELAVQVRVAGYRGQSEEYGSRDQSETD